MTFNPLSRAGRFCASYNLQIPILMAPMAAACPASLAITVANSGGMGACGCLLMQPDEITEWARQMRAGSNGAVQLNIWIPDPDPLRDPAQEEQLRAFLSQWGPKVVTEDAEELLPDFDAQCPEGRMRIDW